MIRAMMDIPVRIFIIDYRGYAGAKASLPNRGYIWTLERRGLFDCNRGIPPNT